MKDFRQIVNEQAYNGNLGFAEMVKFYQIASNSEISKMESIIKSEDWNGFKALIKKVTGDKLK